MVRRPGLFPTWVQSLGAMTDGDARVAVGCPTCKGWRVLDREALIALAEKVGREYSLINRRCRCRLTPGCGGWNKFHYCNGVFRPLFDEATATSWFLGTPVEVLRQREWDALAGGPRRR